MTLFYLKWEEFFGAWLEKHGQSILIVYGSLAVLAVIASATKPRFATSALLLSRQFLLGLKVAAPLLRSSLKTIICLFLSGHCLAFKLSVTSQKSNFSANIIDTLSCQQQTVAKALINIESLACFSKTLPLWRLSYFWSIPLTGSLQWRKLTCWRKCERHICNK